MSKEHLVDVKKDERLLHVFPVRVPESISEEEAAAKQKALEAAAHARLVPNEELPALEAQMHTPRPGPLRPYGDPLGVLAETPEGLDQHLRECAYRLWEQAGRPDHRAEEFWHAARHQRLRDRAYALWEREGCQPGRAEEHWFRVVDFERG